MRTPKMVSALISLSAWAALARLGALPASERRTALVLGRAG